MPTRAANQVALGSYVYLFESPAVGMADCAISAHGAVAAGHSFIVPPNVTVNFLSSYNRPVVHHVGPTRTPLQRAAAPAIDRGCSFQAGARCADQILGKSLGAHWDDPSQRDLGQYYQYVASVQTGAPGAGAHWSPHFISIRNRKFPFSNDYIWLSQVISLVLAHNPNITNFYSFACRGIDTGGTLAGKAGSQAFQPA